MSPCIYRFFLLGGNMKYLLTWMLVFIIIYLFYLFFVIFRKKKIDKFLDNVYANYLIRTYKLEKNKINVKKLAHLVAISNAFIIATTFVIISFVKNFILMMLLAFIVLIPLQLIVYNIIGKYLKRSEKNV